MTDPKTGSLQMSELLEWEREHRTKAQAQAAELEREVAKLKREVGRASEASTAKEREKLLSVEFERQLDCERRTIADLKAQLRQAEDAARRA